MATNTGNGFRNGPVRDRFQMLNPATGLFTVFSVSMGKILRVKKSPGKAKGIRARSPKQSRLG